MSNSRSSQVTPPSVHPPAASARVSQQQLDKETRLISDYIEGLDRVAQLAVERNDAADQVLYAKSKTLCKIAQQAHEKYKIAAGHEVRSARIQYEATILQAEKAMMQHKDLTTQAKYLNDKYSSITLAVQAGKKQYAESLAAFIDARQKHEAYRLAISRKTRHLSRFKKAYDAALSHADKTYRRAFALTKAIPNLQMGRASPLQNQVSNTSLAQSSRSRMSSTSPARGVPS